MAANEPVLAVNVVAVALAATVTEAGTVKTFAMPPEIATTAPAAGAAALNATVQVVLALEARLAALHWSEETVTGAASDTLTELEEPFSDAVRVAV